MRYDNRIYVHRHIYGQHERRGTDKGRKEIMQNIKDVESLVGSSSQILKILTNVLQRSPRKAISKIDRK